MRGADLDPRSRPIIALARPDALAVPDDRGLGGIVDVGLGFEEGLEDLAGVGVGFGRGLGEEGLVELGGGHRGRREGGGGKEV
jgi:hypothetical protein